MKLFTCAKPEISLITKIRYPFLLRAKGITVRAFTIPAKTTIYFLLTTLTLEKNTKLPRTLPIECIEERVPYSKSINPTSALIIFPDTEIRPEENVHPAAIVKSNI